MGIYNTGQIHLRFSIVSANRPSIPKRGLIVASVANHTTTNCRALVSYFRKDTQHTYKFVHIFNSLCLFVCGISFCFWSL